MTSKTRATAYLRITCAGLALVVSAAAAPALASAAEPEPCWKTLVRDWSDGAISNLYPIQCYRQALRNMPEDVRLYSSAGDDINRALSGRVASRGLAAAGSSGGPALQASAVTSGGSSNTSLALAGFLAALLAMAVGGGYLLQRRGRAAGPRGGTED